MLSMKADANWRHTVCTLTFSDISSAQLVSGRKGFESCQSLNCFKLIAWLEFHLQVKWDLFQLKLYMLHYTPNTLNCAL